MNIKEFWEAKVKVITLRLSDEECELIAGKAKDEYRPISKFFQRI
jgi:hypothetical protein